MDTQVKLVLDKKCVCVCPGCVCVCEMLTPNCLVLSLKFTFGFRVLLDILKLYACDVHVGSFLLAFVFSLQESLFKAKAPIYSP